MGINTDLNKDPYYDDFDETKQFNRILFRPARALQARELTQLQTILQNQIERFGSNVYKEGTIISGVNLTSRNDINYVKLKDSSDFQDPTQYVSGPTEDNITYILSNNAGLRAEIVAAAPGFETQVPDLKTFWVSYLNTGANGQTQFVSNEFLTITKQTKNVATGDILEEITEPVTPIVASTDENAGKAFGVSCEEGVIYQKGHFIFVENQFIVISKYSNTPDDVSVGFVIDEFLTNSDEDSSLLDNASGFNNENAPGADRLKLVPRLASFATGSEPDDFFTLMRFNSGEIVRLRDRTEFNTISREMARRTYEESGNYIVSGLTTRLEELDVGVVAAINPGKAYVFGREVQNVATKRLYIEPTTSTQTQQNQVTSVEYGSYYTYNFTTGQTLNTFLIDGTRYDLKLSDGTAIGECSISNVTQGRIYVYAIKKLAGYESVAPDEIGDTVLTNDGKLFGPNDGGRLFDTGKSFLSSIENVNHVIRVREAVTSNQASFSANVETGEFPLTSSIVGVNSVTEVVVPDSVSIDANGTVTVEFPESLGPAGFVYYDKRRSAIQHDTLTQTDGYVKSAVNAQGIIPLGVPNVVRILEVKNNDGVDVTSKFKLVNNQKDDYYDFSHIRLKAGESLSNTTNLTIKFTRFRRTSTVSNGYLTINSYANIDKTLVSKFESRDGRIYDLKNCFDYRPYVDLAVTPSVNAEGAPVVPSQTITTITSNITPAAQSQIICQQSYYLSRIDNIVIDEFGDFRIVKGAEAETPSAPVLNGLYSLSRIFVPGNDLSISGNSPVKITDLSNKTYTMKDIYNIDKKIDKLIETVSLSLLETQAKDFFVDDGNGNNRFKTGILVDACRDLSTANIIDPEFKAGVDKSREVITPSVFQYPIDMILADTNSGVNINQYQDLITIGDTGSRVTLIEQKYATQQRNCVTNFYNYSGKAEIFPAFDVGYDVTTNPTVNIEIDVAESMLDLVDNIQEFIPLTREEEIERTTEFQGIRENRISVETIRNRVSELSASTVTNTTTVGNFISDFAMTPFIRSREVKIIVTGLRPGSRHYFFFEEADVNKFVYPGAIPSTLSFTSRNVRKFGNAGDPIVASDNGTVIAIFEIPAERFFTGECTLEIADVPRYEDFGSGRTSYAKVNYRAYNYDIGRTELSATTRSVDFDIENTITERTIQRDAPLIPPPAPSEPVPEPVPEPTPGTPAPTPNARIEDLFLDRFERFNFGFTDPIAQTFIVRASQSVRATCIYLSDIEVFFGKKSSTVGVTLEVREVINGYPSSKVVPFGRKHLTSSEVTVDPNAAVNSTKFVFDNPVKLLVEKEYCFVVIPDANSPDYLIWTAQVGDVDVNEDVAITNDWGDGVLFTSTNDRAWKSYQDEDIKFRINRYDFQRTASYANLKPNNPEFFTLSNNVGVFQNDEFVYSPIVAPNTSLTRDIVTGASTIVIDNSADTFAVNKNQYLLLQSSNGNKILAKVLSAEDTDGNGNTDTFVLDTAWPYENTSVTVQVVAVGRVSLFNKLSPTKLHLYESSAIGTGAFTVSSTVTGFVSGATASIDSIDNMGVSYFQPQILVDNSIKTASTLQLYKIIDDQVMLDRQIDDKGNVYLLNNARTINSTSNIVTNNDVEDDFIIRVNMTNNGFPTVTPLLDANLSMLNVYEYQITSLESTTSKYISKEVILEEGFEATGLKVLLSAYRPAGTVIEVYGRFVYPTDVDKQSDWIELINLDPTLYSNVSNTKDYRDFEYDLPETNQEYSTFQIKISMRHMTPQEIEDNNLGVTEGNAIVSSSLFPHINDYRAISLL